MNLLKEKPYHMSKSNGLDFVGLVIMSECFSSLQ